MVFNKMFINRQLLFVLTLNQIFFTVFAEVSVKYLENCDPNSNNLLKYNITIKTVNKKQIANGLVLVQAPLDNSLRVNASIELLVGKNYVYLFSVNEKRSCDAMHKYLGEFVYDLERRVGLIQGACPIPKNKYHVYNLPIDCNKITTASNFPFGTLRITAHLFDSKNSDVCCMISVIENNILHQ